MTDGNSDGDHDDAVHAHHAVVGAVTQYRVDRIQELYADEDGEEAGKQEQDEEGHQVLDTDDLVVRAEGEESRRTTGALNSAQPEPLARPALPNAYAHQPAHQPEDVSDYEA